MNWYYLENGQQKGPVTDTDFPSFVQQGVIRMDTYLWCEGMKEWQTYAALLGQPAAQPAAQPAEAGGLRVKQETAVEAPPVDNDVACSRCGAVVPQSTTKAIGTAILCPQCQGGNARLGWSVAPAMDYANPWLRLAAFLLDFLFFSLTVAAVYGLVLLAAYLAARMGAFSTREQALAAGKWIAAAYCIWVFFWSIRYFVGNISRVGSTWGMRLLKLKVVAADGELIGFWRALGRHLLFNLASNFTCFLINLFPLFDKQRRGVHDMACGTVVIKL